MMDNSHLFGEVTGHLAQWQRRRRWVDALLWLPRGILAGLVAAAAVAALARFRPVLLNREVAFVTLALALIGFLIGPLILYLRRPMLLEQARFFDRQFDLQERVSTAVEIQTGRLTVAPMLAEHQLADTAEVVSSVDARSRLPLRPRWPDMIMVLLATILLVLAVALPNAQAFILAEQQAVDRTVAEEIVRLQAVEQVIEEEPALDDVGREALLEPIRAALEELSAGQLSREEATAVLSEAEAELRELSEAGSGLAGNGQATTEALQAAGHSLAENASSASLGQAMASGELAQAAEAAKQLADNLGLLSTAQQDSLARDLQESAIRLAEVDPELAGELAEVAQALQRGEFDQAQQAMREAAATMKQRALEQAVADQALEAADELLSARGEVAAAGRLAGATSGDQSGQPSAGQGQAGQASAAGPGDSPDAGSGMSPGAGNDAQDSQGAGGPGPGGGHADTVFVPDYIDLGSEDGVDIQLPAECVANPENCGQLINESPTEFADERGLVPYEQVFGDYRDAAFEALKGDYVPLGMKGLVRDYFSSLEP